MITVTLNKDGKIVKTEGGMDSKEFKLQVNLTSRTRLNPSPLMQVMGLDSQVITQERTLTLVHGEALTGTGLEAVKERIVNPELLEALKSLIEEAGEITDMDESTSDLLYISALLSA